MIFWVVLALLVLIALLGAPLFAVFGAFVLFAFTALQIDTSVIIISLYQIADTPILIAIPLFVFAGYVLAESKAPQRMVHPDSRKESRPLQPGEQHVWDFRVRCR